MKQLFAPTYVNEQGLRTLMRAAQGREMFDTRESAEEWLRAVLDGHNGDRVESIYGKSALGTFRVDVFRCWDNGDPMGVYVTEEES